MSTDLEPPMAGPEGVPSDVLEDVAYLARSPNRVRVLEALITEPRSTRALREATDTTKTTLNRILNEFQERSWADRTAEGQYGATPQGEHVSIQFRALVDSLSVIQDLGENVAVLPANEMTIGDRQGLPIGIGPFADSTVKRQRPEAQGVGRDELLEAARQSKTMNVLTDMSHPRILGHIIEDRVNDGELSGSIVCTTGLVEYYEEAQKHPPNWGELIEAGFVMYRYGDTVPANIAVFDDVTLVWGAADQMRRRVIISQDENVRGWAIDVVERYRSRSEPLDPELFG